MDSTLFCQLSSLSKEWLTEREVAGLIGRSTSSLQKDRFYRRGLRYSRIGRQIRYSANDVKAYMQNHAIYFEEEYRG